MAKKSKTDAQLVALLASTDYAVHSAAGEEIEAVLAKSPARATAICELGLTLTSRDALDRVGYTCLPAIVKSRGKQLPAAYDILVSVFGDPEEVRRVFRSIPEPRRT